MQFVDNSVTRHIVRKSLLGVHETLCGLYNNPAYDSKDSRADEKMPLCKTCKRLAIAAIRKVEEA